MIFPAALAVAQDIHADGQEFITACVVGYEVGCRAGEYLGKSHYEVCIVRKLNGFLRGADSLELPYNRDCRGYWRCSCCSTPLKSGP